MAKGYYKTIRAKLLHVVDVTFCSIPTNGTNCWYLVHLIFRALVERCEPAKKGSSGGVQVASSMLKLEKR